MGVNVRYRAGILAATGIILMMVTEASAMKCFFKEQTYSLQASRIVSAAVGGGSDISECVKTIKRIKEGDDNSWYREWFAVAEQREKAAKRLLSQGDSLSAKKEYFRAANYYRAAECFLHTNPKDHRILKISRKSRECFIAAADLSLAPIKPVEIPFEGTTLPGYLCLVDTSGAQRPLLIIQTGFDGTGEELYFLVAHAALERGYNCLIFEGPGQGRVIREQKIPLRHKWETVVSPVVDFALQQKEVDPQKIALVGMSLGGYLAPRAAAFEPRIKALIVNGGVYDFHAVVMKKGSGLNERMLDTPFIAKEVDRVVHDLMKKETGTRWAMSNGMYTFGARSPSDWMKKTRPYKMKGVIDKIKCPVLVVESEKDTDMPGQSKQFFKALKGPKELLTFTAEDGVEESCQMGAYALSNEKIFNWLDKTIKKSE